MKNANKRKYTIYAEKEKLELINVNNINHVKEYFENKSSLSDLSKKSYQSDFNQWFVFILDNYGNIDIVDMDLDDSVEMLDDWIDFCFSHLCNNEKRVQRRIASISSFYQYLRKKRKIKDNPAEYIERPKNNDENYIKQTLLTLSDVRKIRSALRQIDETQLELFFEFGLSTMAKVSTICDIEINKINFETGIIDVSEGDKEAVLLPSLKCIKLMKTWLRERSALGIESDYLFLARHKGEWGKAKKITLQSSWIKKIGKLIGEPELHCYDLRQSGSNLLYNAGMPLEMINKILNHKSSMALNQHEIDYLTIQSYKYRYDI